jgi:hypothetical protein
MWWLDPGKEVLNVVRTICISKMAPAQLIQLFNRILAPYVLNLDMNQVNYGIGQGLLKPYPSFSQLTFGGRSNHAPQTAPQEGRSRQV